MSKSGPLTHRLLSFSIRLIRWKRCNSSIGKAGDPARTSSNIAMVSGF
jgi:hypothetical protein